MNLTVCWVWLINFSKRLVDFSLRVHLNLLLILWTSFKGALYRIWCGVNRLGDSGVKVV